METIFDFVVTNDWRLNNPAGRALLKILSGEKRLREHHAEKSCGDVAAAIR